MGMSTADYEKQRDSGARFVTMSRGDAIACGALEKPETPGDHDEWWGWVVVERAPGQPPRVVGDDGGEPEDQSLVRDWQWVTPALNAAYEAGQAARYEHEDGEAEIDHMTMQDAFDEPPDIDRVIAERDIYRAMLERLANGHPFTIHEWWVDEIKRCLERGKEK